MKVYELLDKPEKWIQGTMALDSRREECDPRDDKAVCFCLAGAVAHCYPIDLYPAIRLRIEARVRTMPTSWNDREHRTYEEVIALAKELDI